MAKNRFLIAPYNSGWHNNVEPWLIPDTAFAQLNNAYVWRGRVRKRFGSRLMQGTSTPTTGYEQLQSRLRINLGNIAASPTSFNLPGGITQLAIGQMFSAGDNMFNVFQLGAGVTTLTTNAGITVTIDSTVNPNTVTFTGAAAVGLDAYYYPATPVMGITTYEQPDINNEVTIAFDTQFAYQYQATGWERIGTAEWTGSDSQFFWATNWRGVNDYDILLFVTNYNDADQIKYWDGTTWTNFNPQINAAGDTLESARIVIPFKDRLVTFNTVENIGGTPRTFVNRCRFSQNGDPVTPAENPFREDIAGKGNFRDAPTKEAIITAQALRDRLIVYFERSTWELVYTGNEVSPFVWQKINTELGAESTFSEIPFDREVLGIGQVGVHSCTGNSVDRIDQNIPDEVFKIHNDNAGVQRVAGIRDYKLEMAYWTYPSANKSSTQPYPDKVLVYNYVNRSWGLNDDSITAFGYFYNLEGLTWGDASTTWGETYTLWGSGLLEARFRNTIAGNQEGFTFIIDGSLSRNAPALSITDMSSVVEVVTVTSIDHNFQIGDFVLIENSQGITEPNDNIFQITTVPSKDTFTFSITGGTSGTYTGAGTVTRVSRIDILSKQYNFYVKQGRNADVQAVDFLVTKTNSGSVLVDYFASTAGLPLVEEGSATGMLLGTSTLQTSPYTGIPLEATQSRLWHSVYTWAEGECIQFRIYLSDELMTDNDTALSPFTIHAMMIHASPSQFIGVTGV